MRDRYRFTPLSESCLESRVVLSHASRSASIVVSGLNPASQVLKSGQEAIDAEVSQAFASFTSDYDQARATYFASIANQTAVGTSTTNAFKLFTTERVALLGQELISSFLQSPQGTSRVSGHNNSLQELISTKIIGPENQAPEGSLAKSLYETMPVPGTSAPTESLYSLSQDEAIQAAEATVTNTVNVLRVGDYGNTTPKMSH